MMLIEELEHARKIEDTYKRTHLLVKIAQPLKDELKIQILREALAVACTGRNEYTRVFVLEQLAPYLNVESQLPHEACTAIFEIKDDKARAEGLAILAQQLNNEFKIRIILDYLAAIHKTEDELIRVRTLQDLTPFLNADLLFLQDVLTVVSEIKNEGIRVLVLENLTKHLNTQPLAVQAVLAIAREIKDERIRANTLVALTKYLKEELKIEILREALAVIYGMEDEYIRVRAISDLAPFLATRSQVLQVALVMVREIKDESNRTRAFVALAQHLDGELKTQTLQEALSVIRDMKDEPTRARALEYLARFVNTRSHLFQEVLAVTQRIKDKIIRTNLLEILAPPIEKHVPHYNTDNNVRPRVSRSSQSASDRPKEEVSFTTYHPKEGGVGLWYTLLVYAHMLSALVKVRKDTKRFDDQIKSPKEATSLWSTPIALGTELTIVPSCEGVTFNPERISFKWIEDFHRADFRFKADKSLSGDAAKGSVDIYVGPLIVGTLKFAMLFNEKEAIQPVPDHEEYAKMYGKNDVFISYSRKDTDVARTFKTVLESSGLDVFLDVDDIRSGQLWEEELKRRIEQAKIFQIFWSQNYSQSENCKQEWKYALKQNKEEGYIRPVYWNTPLSPKPPEELKKFNFKYVELKIANSE